MRKQPNNEELIEGFEVKKQLNTLNKVDNSELINILFLCIENNLGRFERPIVLSDEENKMAISKEIMRKAHELLVRVSNIEPNDGNLELRRRTASLIEIIYTRPGLIDKFEDERKKLIEILLEGKYSFEYRNDNKTYNKRKYLEFDSVNYRPCLHFLQGRFNSKNNVAGFSHKKLAKGPKLLIYIYDEIYSEVSKLLLENHEQKKENKQASASSAKKRKIETIYDISSITIEMLVEDKESRIIKSNLERDGQAVHQLSRENINNRDIPRKRTIDVLSYDHTDEVLVRHMYGIINPDTGLRPSFLKPYKRGTLHTADPTELIRQGKQYDIHYEFIDSLSDSIDNASLEKVLREIEKMENWMLNSILENQPIEQLNLKNKKFRIHILLRDYFSVDQLALEIEGEYGHLEDKASIIFSKYYHNKGVYSLIDSNLEQAISSLEKSIEHMSPWKSFRELGRIYSCEDFLEQKKIAFTPNSFMEYYKIAIEKKRMQGGELEDLEYEFKQICQEGDNETKSRINKHVSGEVDIKAIRKKDS